jgi:hypothetical protein
LPHTKGKESKSKKYTGGTLFDDHSSQVISRHHQISLGVGEILKAKYKFKKWAKEHGVTVKKYHADDAPFQAENFLQDCVHQGQQIDYSGVGAHHQIGVAKRTICTVTQWARAMMIHQAIHCPAKARLDLWPFALDHPIYL